MRKRSIKNKVFITLLKIQKDFLKLIYYSYGLWIIGNNESWGIKELLENTWIKSDRDKKKKLIVRVFADSENGVQLIKPDVEIKTGTGTLAVNFIK